MPATPGAGTSNKVLTAGDFGITLRTVKGSELTFEEMDRNLKVTSEFIKYVCNNPFDTSAEEFAALMNTSGSFGDGADVVLDGSSRYVAMTIGADIAGSSIYLTIKNGAQVAIADANLKKVLKASDSGTYQMPSEGYIIITGYTGSEVHTGEDSGNGGGGEPSLA